MIPFPRRVCANFCHRMFLSLSLSSFIHSFLFFPSFLYIPFFLLPHVLSEILAWYMHAYLIYLGKGNLNLNFTLIRFMHDITHINYRSAIQRLQPEPLYHILLLLPLLLLAHGADAEQKVHLHPPHMLFSICIFHLFASVSGGWCGRMPALLELMKTFYCGVDVCCRTSSLPAISRPLLLMPLNW